jgi:hypothetical protein
MGKPQKPKSEKRQEEKLEPPMITRGSERNMWVKPKNQKPQQPPTYEP